MVSARNEEATAATRRDWYLADPRAYIRIAALLRERITAHRAASFRTVSQAARKRCLPGLRSRHPQANASLDEEFTHNGELMSLRLIYLHMIEEYARHIGHADFLREQIDGATGE